jgi:hypothetical protein
MVMRTMKDDKRRMRMMRLVVDIDGQELNNKDNVEG